MKRRAFLKLLGVAAVGAVVAPVAPKVARATLPEAEAGTLFMFGDGSGQLGICRAVGLDYIVSNSGQYQGLYRDAVLNVCSFDAIRQTITVERLPSYL